MLFFPKREDGRRKTPYEFSSPLHRTLPELAAVEEPATEPFGVMPVLGFEDESTRTDAEAAPRKKPRRRKTGELKVKTRRRVTEEVAKAIGWVAVEKKKARTRA